MGEVGPGGVRAMNLRTLIVDDEPLGRERLRTQLRDEPDVTVVGECEDGGQAVEALRGTPCDLVFLDVRMPVLDGLGVVRAVGPGLMPVFIFVTAYDRYAVPAFEVRAADYLLNPFARHPLRQAGAPAREQGAPAPAAHAG